MYLQFLLKPVLLAIVFTNTVKSLGVPYVPPALFRVNMICFDDLRTYYNNKKLETFEGPPNMTEYFPIIEFLRKSMILKGKILDYHLFDSNIVQFFALDII